MIDGNKERYFSKDKQALALKWLNERWTNRICECCGRNEWTLAEDLVMPTTFMGGGGLVIGGPAYPQMMVICKNCGNIKAFNAIIAGIVPPKVDGGENDKK